MPDHFKIWTGHDYPPKGDGREHPLAYQTVAEQKSQNKHLKDGVKQEEFVKWRSERDSGLKEPRLIHQALQVNIRAGRLPPRSLAGDRLVHVPLKVPGGDW